MASKTSKRRADVQTEEEESTPIGKRLRPTTTSSKKNRCSETEIPVFELEEREPDVANMSNQPCVPKSPKPPTTDEIKAILREGLANVARKEQLDLMMDKVTSNSEALRTLEKKVDSSNEETELRFRSIEDKLLGNQNTESATNQSKRATFDKARRSLRAWPIKGNDPDKLNANFRDFVVEALQIADTTVRNSAIKEVIRVRSSPQNKVYSEVIVMFEDRFERDFYISMAKNLAEFHDEKGITTAGLRIDVPPFLMSTFKLLSKHGYEIRSTHGRETR